MGHDKIGPREQALRELKAQRYGHLSATADPPKPAKIKKLREEVAAVESAPPKPKKAKKRKARKAKC